MNEIHGYERTGEGSVGVTEIATFSASGVSGGIVIVIENGHGDGVYPVGIFGVWIQNGEKGMFYLDVH